MINPMVDSISYEYIAKVLSGEASKAEHEMVDQWKNASNHNQQLFDALENSWNETRTKITLDERDRDLAYYKIMANANAQNSQITRPNVSHKSHSPYLKIAATISLFIMATLLTFWIIGGLPKFDQHAHADDVSTIVKSVIKGQKLKIHLPDGSIVWLNSESSISYPERFTDTVRKVDLAGEAYFEVVKNPDQPFIVQTGEISAKVLGTTFNVRNYGDDKQVNVALVTGKISVISAKHPDEFILTPGERLIYDTGNDKYIKQNFDLKTVTAWKDGILYFEDATYEEVINTLERWYGVEFVTVNRGSSSWKFTGEFKNEYLDIVLNSISYSKNFTYIIDQNKVYVKF
jgi:transmembrane sensor